MLILRPRASRMAPKEAEAIPLPSEETTPPVTKTNRFIMSHRRLNVCRPQFSGSPNEAMGTMGIRREFRLADRRVPDKSNYVTRGALFHASPSPGASAAAHQP